MHPVILHGSQLLPVHRRNGKFGGHMRGESAHGDSFSWMRQQAFHAMANRSRDGKNGTGGKLGKKYFWLSRELLEHGYKFSDFKLPDGTMDKLETAPWRMAHVFIDEKKKLGIWHTNPDGSKGGFVEVNCAINGSCFISKDSFVVDSTVVSSSNIASSVVKGSILSLSELKRADVRDSEIAHCTIDTCHVKRSTMTSKTRRNVAIIRDEETGPWPPLLSFKARLPEVK